MTQFTPRSPAWRARIETAFAAQGMMTTLGVGMVEAAPGRVTLRAPIRPETAQQHGYAHAGLSFTLGDTAAGFAAQSLMAEGDGVLTIEMKINLMAPGRGDSLRAEGKVLRAGARITVAQAEIWAETAGQPDVHIATLLGTMMTMKGHV